MKQAFSLIELIFVIVIIGILASLAIPRFFSGISEAKIAKAKTQIATIKSGIASKYSKNIISGKADECPYLENSVNDNLVFENVISGGIAENQSDINWTLESSNSQEIKYILKIDNYQANFTYEVNASKDCPFKCVNSTGDLCNKLQ